MGSTFIPTKTGFTRVFLIENRAGPSNEPDYEHSLKMMGLEQSFGDVENIFNPDPRNFGKFEIIGSIRQEADRPTTQLMGRYAADIRSRLLTLAKIGCETDVQLHIGQCTDPSDFNEFQKIVVLEGALIPNYSTEDLGALQPDEKAVVNETADISAREVYEVVPITYAERGGTTVTNSVNDVVICDGISCGDCDDPSDGCQKFFAVTDSAGGSPGTPADIVWSLDSGTNIFARDIDTMANASVAVACVKDQVVALESGQTEHHFTALEDFDEAATVLIWTVVTGYDDVPLDIWSVGSVAYLCGENGHVWRMTDPTAAADLVDAGVATTEDLNAVHALNEEFAVAVGENGAVVFSENGFLWAAATASPVAASLSAVWVKSEDEWWVGTGAGQVFYTLDRGANWTEKTFPGSGSGQVHDIQFPTDSVGWLAHETAGSDGRILRSYNGGFDWVITPEGSTQLPTNTGIDALAACIENPNFVVGVGDNSADGIIVVGTGA